MSEQRWALPAPVVESSDGSGGDAGARRSVATLEAPHVRSRAGLGLILIRIWTMGRL